jgi:signal transduction histidine kinase
VSANAVIVVLATLSGAALAVLLAMRVRVGRQRRALAIQSEEIRRQQRELQHLREQAAEADRQRKQVISMVSHDLKGPFNRIFALTQLMTMGEPLSAQQAAYLQHIHRLVADGLSMVRNVVDTRSLEGELTAHPERLSVNEAISAAVQPYLALAEKKKIGLRWQPQTDYFILADRAMLARVLDNVLSNAIKFSKEHKEVFINTKTDGAFVGIAIRDQGRGFTPDDQANLYKKFQKLSARPTGGETSTGLGLWIAKLLMDKMGGRIDLQTEPGAGSEFTLYLPVS